jgi:putative pyruvate formate lyase activating enzyme
MQMAKKETGSIPSYIALYESGRLQDRIEKLTSILKECTLCPRRCKVDRTSGETGTCKAGERAVVSSVFPHFGEEQPLVGRSGSGTIFLTHCNLRCIFCQNYDISHEGRGEEVSTGELSEYMIALKSRGCHNINFVTPTHYVPQIVASLPAAIEMGLDIPIVYNTGGYDSIEVIRLLDGIVDIYMPDYKFTDSGHSKKYMNAPDYPVVIKEVLREMHRQVGDLATDSRGIAYRGLLIRHLVMPNDLAGTKEAVSFIAGELSRDSYVNIMEQYHPEYLAHKYPELKRRITIEEYMEAVRLAKDAGLNRGF